MDRKSCVVHRTRELIGDRLDTLLHVVERDIASCRGGVEPEHIRGVIRRSFGEAIPKESASADVAVAEVAEELAAELVDQPQRREEIEGLLRSGQSAVRRLLQADMPELTKGELLGLECCLALYGRPAILVGDQRMAPISDLWKGLESQRELIELTQRAVGRIELLGHPEYDWCGTGFLVGETTLLTTREVALIFSEYRDGCWQFKPGVSAWLDNRSRNLHPINAGCRIEHVLAIDERANCALLRVERAMPSATMPTPLKIAARAPSHPDGRDVYMVGYPIRDSRQNESQVMSRIFRDVYDVKRVHPGKIRREFNFGDVPLFEHDCGMLGNTGGGCVVDLETHEVLGLQVFGRSMATGTALALWRMRDWPILRDADVGFAVTDAAEIEWAKNAVGRMAQTSHWTKFHAYIREMYHREFGEDKPC